MTLDIIPPLIGFALNVFLAILVIRRQRNSLVYHVSAIFLAAMGVWVFTLLGTRVAQEMETALLWQRATFIMFTVVSVSFYHLVSLLTGIRARWLITLAYFCMAVGIGLALTAMVVSDTTYVSSGYGFMTGPLFPPYVLVFYGFIILALFELVRAYIASKTGVELKRYFCLGLGAAFYLLALSTDILAATGTEIYPLGVWGSISFSVLAGCTILNYDVRMLIQRWGAYIFVLAVGAALLILGTALLSGAMEVVYLLGEQYLVVAFGIEVALIAIVTIILLRVLRWTQNRMDRWFNRGRFDYLKTLEDLGKEPKTITDLNYLSNFLVSSVVSVLGCESVSLLLPDAEGTGFHTVASEGTKNGNELSLGPGSILPQWLRQSGEVLTRTDADNKPEFKALSATERDVLHSPAAELFVPLLDRGGLRGILVLGCKQSGQDYSPEEIRMLRIMGRQIATTLDNARLYDLERKARLELEKKDQERRDLVNSLVHEINTPLTAILASSELLREELADKATLGELAENMDVAAHNLHRRISELMSFAKVETDGITLKLEPVDINSLIRQSASSVNQLLNNKNQTLHLDVLEEPYMVIADPDRVTQVLLNLLTNAGKFTGSDRKISLHSQKEGNEVIIEVKDSAPPIQAEGLEKIFKPYYSHGQGAGSGGLGLGLFICKKLVELQGGRIWVEVGNSGNSFKFSLPLAPNNGGNNESIVD